MTPERSRIVLTGVAAIAAARARERLWRERAVLVNPKPASGRQKKPGGRHGGGKPPSIPEEREEEILRLRAQGCLYSEIMVLFGCSKHAVVSALSRARKRLETTTNRL